MKKKWTRSEKWLWATPLLLGLVAAGITFVPRAAHRVLGWPESLITTPDNDIRSMALSRNGEVLAAAGSINTKRGWKRGSGTIYLWNARTAKRLATIAPVYTRDSTGFIGGFDVYGLALSPDAKQIGFTRVAQNWALYDVATQKQLWSFPSFISDAEFSRDGRFVALSGASIVIVRASDGRVRTKWKRSGLSNSGDLAWSPNGTWIAIIGNHKTVNFIELYGADSGKLVRRIPSTQEVSGETVESVAFSPDSRQLVVVASVGSYDSSNNFNMFAPVRCYSASTGRLLWEVKSPDFGGGDGTHASFCDAIFSPDGRVVAAYQYHEGKVFLLDSATGAIKTTLNFGRVRPSSFFVPPGLEFSPDGKRLFARGRSEILFWDLE